MQYAKVIVDLSATKLDKAFDYKVPEKLFGKAVVGAWVDIPFGNANRVLKGLIVELTQNTDYEDSKIKEIISLTENKNSIDDQLISLAIWMREKYGSTMIQALKVVLPVKNKVRQVSDKIVTLKLDDARAKEMLLQYKKKNHKAKARLLEAVLKERTIKLSDIKKELSISDVTLQSLISDGVLQSEEIRLFRNPIDTDNAQSQVELNFAQQQIVDKIEKDINNNTKKNYLLHGVTGSGKTEVYIKIIEKVIAMDKEAIVLIPEIALTFQTVNRFTGYFGDKVSILHSRMSAGERYDQMQRARNKEIKVIIGPRSALFTPFTNLGVIIVDEEHENSYKSELSPKYDARDVAIKRAQLCDAFVVLGSATPSIESYYRARCNIYELLELKERVSKKPLPKVYVEDLREELKSGNRSIFSDRLRNLIRDRLDKKQQVMLFLNRRGYMSFISCRSCGLVMKCPHCDVSLSLHKGGRLICHYCGYETKETAQCPECGSKYISGFKAGTQQIEALVNKEFPDARVLRMDLDTTKGKKGHEQIVKAFSNEEADILIGTQMIVKGHDFKNVTLVGILAADLSLNSSSYMGSERTFQLLVQAAGRAGRGDLAGEVVIQTYNTSHYSIQCAAKQDYEEFYNKEIAYRKMMNYPPAGNMLELCVISEIEELLLKIVNYVKLQVEQANINNIKIIGPAPAAIYKLQDKYRYMFYFKSNDEALLKKVRAYLENVIKHFNEKYNCGVLYQFDLN